MRVLQFIAFTALLHLALWVYCGSPTRALEAVIIGYGVLAMLTTRPEDTRRNWDLTIEDQKDGNK